MYRARVWYPSSYLKRSHSFLLTVSFHFYFIFQVFRGLSLFLVFRERFHSIRSPLFVHYLQTSLFISQFSTFCVSYSVCSCHSAAQTAVINFHIIYCGFIAFISYAQFRYIHHNYFYHSVLFARNTVAPECLILLVISLLCHGRNLLTRHKYTRI